MKKFLALILVLALVLSVTAVFAQEKMYIPVISKGEQHAFWQAVRKGANDAAEKYGVDMFYYGPPSEADIVPQVEALKAEMAKNPKALALAALSTDAVMTELQEAISKNIPVIGFDSGVPGAPEGAIKATASTNNQNAAALAAEKLLEIEALQAKLKEATAENPVLVSVLSQDATSESVTGRTTGFVNKFVELAAAYGTVEVQGHTNWAVKAENPTIVLHVEVGASPKIDDMTNAANAILNKDNLAAIFCSNEGAVAGLLAATADGSEFAEGARFGGILVAGFDAGAPQKNAVRNNWFVGSVTQDPYNIGYLAVELAYKAAMGEEVADVDTGAQWYTKDNIDNPDIAILVYD